MGLSPGGGVSRGESPRRRPGRQAGEFALLLWAIGSPWRKDFGPVASANP